MNKKTTSNILLKLISIAIKKEDLSEKKYHEQLNHELKNIDKLLIDSHNDSQSVIEGQEINEIINPSTASD